MTVLEFMPGEINNQLGMLRHSWLKNKIIGSDPAFIFSLRDQQSNSRTFFEDDIRPFGRFEENFALLGSILLEVVDAYSPVRLINGSPLVDLPDDILESIKIVFENSYLETSNIRSILARAEEVLNDTSFSFTQFRDLWFQNTVDKNFLEESYRDFQRKAESLREVLKLLPSGIVLP